MDVFDLVAKITLDSSEYESGLQEAEKGASGFGQKLTSGLGKAAKVGAGAVAAIGTASTVAGVAFVKSAGSVAAYGDNIDKMSQKMGLSSDAYQEWDAVMRHSGTSMETMKASMKTLANAAENGSEAFEKLGISQQDIASMSQEELFEATITALQGVEDETERTYLAGKTLGRGATELGALLNMSAEDTEKMRKRTRELGGVMSKQAVKASAKYQDSLQDMQTAITGLKNKAMADFLPSMTTVMDGITEIFSGDSNKGIGMVTKGIDGLVSKIGQSMPKILSVGGKLFTAFSGLIAENLPKVISALVGFVTTNLPVAISGLLNIALPAVVSLITSIAQSLPETIQTLWTTLTTTISGLLNAYFPTLGAIFDQLVGIVEGVVTTVQAIWQTWGATIMAYAQTVWNNIKIVIQTVLGVIQGIITTVTGIISGDWSAAWNGIKQIASSVWNGIKSLVSNMINGVKTIICNVVDAIKSKWGTAWDTIKTKVSTIFDSIKSTIKSKMDAAKQTVTSVLDGIKTAFSTKLNSAKQTVKSVIDKIKGFFNFSWSLPKLKMPHISITGSFSLSPPSVPHFSISWYKKALNDAILLDNATIFGASRNGTLLGGGEAGSEMIVGTNLLRNTINDAVGNGQMIDLMRQMLNVMQTYLPEAATRQLVLDTGVIAGAVAGGVDSALGTVAGNKRRYAAS